MVYPKCKSEYQEHIVTCPNCKINLVKHIEKESESKLETINPVKVKSSVNSIDAEMIMLLLKNNNIPCFIKSKEAGSYLNIYMGYSVFGEDIYVDKEDFEEASNLLQELSTPETDENDITEDIHLPFFRNPRIVARIIIITYLGAMILISILNSIH
jgi:hypothetical protein